MKQTVADWFGEKVFEYVTDSGDLSDGEEL